MTARDWLAKRAELEAAATEGPWEQEPTHSVGGEPDGGAELLIHLSSDEDWWEHLGTTEAAVDAEWIADARTSAPAMRKALEAVLELHANSAEYPRECRDGCDWPCPTVTAITDALEATP